MVFPMQLTFFVMLVLIQRHSSEKPFTISTNRTQNFNYSNRSSRCDVAGIVARFQSRGHEKSDDIAQRLVPLAQEMIEYSKLHNTIINSWKTAAPVGHSEKRCCIIICFLATDVMQNGLTIFQFMNTERLRTANRRKMVHWVGKQNDWDIGSFHIGKSIEESTRRRMAFLPR